MKRHPKPTVLARQLRTAAQLIDHHGEATITKARLLAERGWPTTVNGNGSHSADPTSSTEAAALNPGPYTGIDTELADRMRQVWKALADLDHTIWRIHAHGTDDDPLPAGTGPCQRCDRFCKPDAKHPHNRLKAGLCPACNEAWKRAGKPPRSDFVRGRTDAA